MHIVVTRGSSGEVLGGAETEIADTIEELSSQGYKVSLITNFERLYSTANKFAFFATLIPWPAQSGDNLLKRIITNLTFGVRIRREISVLQPDYIICQSRDDLVALGRKRKKNLYYRDHSDLRHYLKPERKSWAARRYQRKFIDSLENAKSIITNSPFEVPMIEQFIKNRVIVMPSGIQFDYKPKSRDFNKKRLTLAVVARLVLSKGAHYFIEALTLMDEKHKKQIRAAIYGSGEQEEYLRNYAKAKGLEIDFMGHQENMKDSYKSIDVLVQTSEYDGWSRVVSEAMYSGCAIIASNIPSHIEQLKGGCGLIFQSKNPQDLAHKITECLDDRQILAGLAKNARKRVVETSDIKNTTKVLINELGQS